MFQKLFLVTASTFALTVGGVFSSSADSASLDVKHPSYKELYTNLENISKEDVSNQLKQVLESLQGDLQLNLDEALIAKLVGKEQATPPTEETQAPEEKQEAPVEEKEEAVEENQEQPVENPEHKEEQPEKQPEKEQQAPQEEQPQQEQEQQQEQQGQQNQGQQNQGQQNQGQQNQEQQQNQEAGALSQFEEQVVELTNQERAKQGLNPLQIDQELSGVAREKSRDMAANGYFDHQSPTYGSPFDMMKNYGVSYRTAGENIAQGQRSPEEVVNAWMNSSGHRANILNAEFTHIGVGYVEQGNHWTQMFIGK